MESSHEALRSLLQIDPLCLKDPESEPLVVYVRAVLPNLDLRPSRLGRSGSKLPDYRVERVLRALDDRWHLPTRVGQLAADVSLSGSRLSHLVSQGLGYSVRTMLTAVRLAHAIRLLALTDFRVSEVGNRVGIPDPAHFDRLVRSHTESTPSCLKRNLRSVALGPAKGPAGRSAPVQRTPPITKKQPVHPINPA